MNRSTGIVIGVSAVAGFIAAWTTIVRFDPDQGQTVARSAPAYSQARMSTLWAAGDMGKVIHECGLWSVAEPASAWPRYYRACALDRIGQDSTSAWQRVVDTAEDRLGDDDPRLHAVTEDAFWIRLLYGQALRRVGRADESEVVFAEAIELLDNGVFAQRVTALYNHACIEAVRDRPESAIDLLEQAADLDGIGVPFWYPWSLHDPDLSSLGEHPRFVALMERLGARRRPD